ncbi:integral membrane protein [Streptomyces lincolnensis]|uniref:Integral membrane protein n=1 Tax=Streptomyces lincolnensis TaxID=1915 RepID=A0A1B1M251_STRLN|nr:integral membrane protein [Streptomyces lincolnensis]AXG51432.1 integral membrane protein [Streptomyces lincolnensis]
MIPGAGSAPATAAVPDTEEPPGTGPDQPADPPSRARIRTLLRRARPAGPRPTAALLAAAITLTALCAAGVVARTYPFGPRTRSINDLGNQYLPFHAHLWDLLHGRADGGLLVNWQSGFGTGFLPDLGTYLSSPFALLVGVFPRDEIDLAVYVITLLKSACAGAAMAWLLLTLRSGRWWAAGLLGASYALCGWSVADAAYNPMWLDGLIALPLLCLVGEWTRHDRHRVLGVLVVALAWIANFYTAYMATAAACLVLLLRLLLAGLPRRRALAALGRAGVTFALGTGLAAPLVTVVYFGSTHASPGRFTWFAPVTGEDLLARLLPATYSFGSPAVFVGTTALLLALALPFHRAAPRRVRAGWPLLVLAVTLSMQWQPTHLAWHAFTTPQGSSYRQAFVLCALLVVAAWHTISYGPPDRRALGAAAGLLVLIAAAASGSGLVRPFVWPILLFAVTAALVGLVLLGRAADPRRTGAGRGAVLAGWAAVLLVGAQLGEATATSAVAARLRLGAMDDYAPWGARQEQQTQAIAHADGWPRYRTDPGREQTVGNDPLMVGGQGAQYYSSHTSDVLSSTLTALGGGWTSGGRSLQSLDNAVTDVIFSVGARVHTPPDPHQNWFPQDGTGMTVSRQEVPPLVTVRPVGTPISGSTYGPSPYRNQELLLGTRVYTLPRFTLRTGTGQPPARANGKRPGLRLDPPSAQGTAPRPTITARCAPGDEVYLWAPHFAGTARLSGAAAHGLTGRFRSDPATKIAAMQRLGTVPATGRLVIDLSPNRPSLIPHGAVGCLDTARLRERADRLTATGATEVTVSDGTLRARLPSGSKGIAVVAAPRTAGWRCATGTAPAVPAENHHGLIAVPLDGSSTSLTCTFHPPGLRLGTTVGAASLLALILWAAATAVRRRRRP